MDKIFECVSFLLIKNDQILLEQRSPFKESLRMLLTDRTN